MSDCLFCKIINGQIPAEKVYEDDSVIAFKDIRPSAREHLLFIHKKHTSNINDMVDSEPDQLKDVFAAISAYTKDSGLVDDGFRVVTNFGKNGGQAVFHTHFHVLGGERLKGFGSR